MNGFYKRAGRHDDIAVPLVVEQFKEADYQCFNVGLENNDAELRKTLQGQHDRTSILFRYRPDRIFIKIGYRSILCEIKSEEGKYKNFAIEVDSFRAAKEWNTNYNHVLYAFVDLETATIKGCWANEIPAPKTIFIPKRWDWGETHKRLGKEFPAANLQTGPVGKGSGTAFFLIAKSSSFLEDIRPLINEFKKESINEERRIDKRREIIDQRFVQGDFFTPEMLREAEANERQHAYYND